MARKPAEFDEHPMAFPEHPMYRGVGKYVVDGDTFDAFIDLGLYNYCYVSIRLHGFDAPEIFRPLSQAEKEAGNRCRDRLAELVLNKPLKLITFRDRQTFERFEAMVYIYEGDEWKSVVEILEAEQLAKRHYR